MSDAPNQFENGKSPASEEPRSVHVGIEDKKGRRRMPWLWVPTAYFAEGIPYIIAMTLSVIMYKKMGISNEQIALWTSLLYLPWTIKPLWGPLVDMYWTKRNWVIWMQLLIAIALGAAAFAINLPGFFKITLIIFFGLAFLSATHDIACDGFYMLGLSEGQQTWFVGIRAAFYRMAMIVGTGILVIIAGWIEGRTGLPPVSFAAVAVKSGEGAAPPPPVPALTYPAPQKPAPGQRIIIDAEKIELKEGEKKAVHIRLAEKPAEGKEVVVSIDRFAGAKSLTVAKGDVIKFTTSNWDEPTTVLIGTSKSLRKSENAEFRATAGNVPLSWTVVLGFCCAMFAFFFLYHSAMLPHPFKDYPESGPDRPPFIRAAFWLGIAMFIAYVLVADLTGLLTQILTPAKTYFMGKGWKLDKGQWDSIFKLVRILLVAAILIWLFLRKSARRVMGAAFNAFAKESGIAFDEVFVSFFRKKGIGLMITFLLLYRLGEAQLVKLAQPFMLDPRSDGGLGLSTADVGIAYGTVGILCLTIGGILGGLAVSRDGLKKWFFLMCCAINIPDALYVYMAYAKPDNFITILGCVGLEQLGYGFGFTAYMVYMLYCAQGEYKTAHFAIATGFMALGMMVPGMISGFLQGIIGYPSFFIAVCIFTLPGFILLPFIPLDPEFGKKKKKEAA